VRSYLSKKQVREGKRGAALLTGFSVSTLQFPASDSLLTKRGTKSCGSSRGDKVRSILVKIQEKSALDDGLQSFPAKRRREEGSYLSQDLGCEGTDNSSSSCVSPGQTEGDKPVDQGRVGRGNKLRTESVPLLWSPAALLRGVVNRCSQQAKLAEGGTSFKNLPVA